MSKINENQLRQYYNTLAQFPLSCFQDEIVERIIFSDESCYLINEDYFRQSE